MSKSKTLNKVMKRSAKTLDKVRNPIDKIARTGVRSSDIVLRVVSGSIEQARIGVDSVLDISTARMRNIQNEKKLKDILQDQLDRTADDARTLVDCAIDSVSLVSDGVVDVLDEVGNGYKDYRDEDKAEKAKRKAEKAVRKATKLEGKVKKPAARAKKPATRRTRKTSAKKAA